MKTVMLVMVMILAYCFDCLAAQNFTVNSIKQVPHEYTYYFNKYSKEDGLMPIVKNGSTVGTDEVGYGDFDGNIVIPINPNWRAGGEFVSGIAVVYDNAIGQCYAINKNGDKAFDISNASRVEMLSSKPDGNILYSMGQDENKIYKMNFYDATGNITKTVNLNEYKRVGKFVDGHANLYITDGYYDWDLFGTITKIEKEVAVGSIDIYGNKSSRTYDDSESVTKEKINDKLYFQQEQNLISVIKDINGTEYSEYRFDNVGRGAGNNRFVGKACKSQEEIEAYINLGTNEDERFIREFGYRFDEEFMPYMIYEVEYN